MGPAGGHYEKARHPEAAKLYLNWLTDKNTQENIWYMWSIKTDVTPPKGYKHIWEYKNTSPEAFTEFMQDRSAIERFRSQMTLYFGEVKGEPSPGWLGLHPEQALKH